MKVLKASFPARQSIAKLVDFELEVENAGAGTAPNVAVSLDSFYYTENYPHLAAATITDAITNRSRPFRLADAPTPDLRVWQLQH